MLHLISEICCCRRSAPPPNGRHVTPEYDDASRGQTANINGNILIYICIYKMHASAIEKNHFVVQESNEYFKTSLD